jgi:membrane protein implicated in regulation of membrane protease activity
MKSQQNNFIDRKWSSRILLRYFLLQLPGMAIFGAIVVLSYHLTFLPSWLAWAVCAVWIIKDIVFYPMVWQAYDPDRQKDRNTMLGKICITTEKLNPEGYVEVNGESWKAVAEISYSPIGKGKEVIITGVEGLKVFVKPVESDISG